MRTAGGLLALLLGASTVLTASGVSAGDAVTTYLVTTAEDGDAGPSTDLSLRGAFAAAVEDGTDSRIVLGIGEQYVLDRCTDGADALLHGGDTALTVLGRGATVEQTCPGDRVVQAGGTGSFRLDGITIAGGDSRTAGGGVAVDGPQQVTVVDSAFVDNRSAADGGALAVIGAGLTLERTSFEGNEARRGGAVWVNGDATVTASTFASNVASSEGGALYAGRDANVRRSTFSANRAVDGTGAALDARYVQLNHVTALGDRPAADGAAVRARSLGLRSGASIVAPWPGSVACDLAGEQSHSLGHNRTTDGSCGLAAATDRDDWIPSLAPLAAAGGPLPTHVPLDEGDTVVDVIPAADPELCGGGEARRHDQRQVGLPQGAGCDVGAVETPSPFTDVGPANPFFSDVARMDAEGISSGYADGTYRPEDEVTRGAMAAFLHRHRGSPAFTPPTTPTFTDVPLGHPFFLEVEWMVADELASGFADGTYRPSDPVSRQAMAAFLHRASGSEAEPPQVATFTDVATTSPFFAEVEWMAEQGRSAGFADGTWRPDEPVTRQAIARFLTS